MKQSKKQLNQIDHYICSTLDHGQLEELVYSTKFDKELFQKIVLNLNRAYKFERDNHRKIYQSYLQVDKNAEYQKEIDNLKSQIHDLNQKLEIAKLKQKAAEDQLKNQEQESFQIKFLNQLQTNKDFNHRKETEFLQDEILELNKDLKNKDSFIRFLKKLVLKQAKEIDKQNFLKRKQNEKQNQQTQTQSINQREQQFLTDKIFSCASKIEEMDELKTFPKPSEGNENIYQMFEEVQDQLQKIEADCQSIWQDTKNCIKQPVQSLNDISEQMLIELNKIKPMQLSCEKHLAQYIFTLSTKSNCETNFLVKTFQQQILTVLEFNQKVIARLFALFNNFTKMIEQALVLQKQILEIEEKNISLTSNAVQASQKIMKTLTKEKVNLPQIFSNQINKENRRSELFQIHKDFLQQIEANNNKFLLSLLNSINSILFSHFSSHSVLQKLKSLKAERLINKASNMIKNEEKLFKICQELIQIYEKFDDDESEESMSSRKLCKENQNLIISVKQNFSSTKALFGEFKQTILIKML